MDRTWAALVHDLAADLLGPSGESVETCRREVAVLLAHVLGFDESTRLYTESVTLTPAITDQLRGLVARRGTGEPTAYLIGHCEFYGLQFDVTPDVLIPRPETELVVDVAREALRGRAAPRMLEIGVGSGAISVALAHHVPDLTGIATDISSAAVRVAASNAARHGVSDRVRMMIADLAPADGPAVDLVASNPPYVDRDDALSFGVREYEPENALFADDSGLAVLRRIVSGADAWLVPGGTLVLEVGKGQADTVCRLLDAAGFEHARSFDDLNGIPRVISAITNSA